MTSTPPVPAGLREIVGHRLTTYQEKPSNPNYPQHKQRVWTCECGMDFPVGYIYANSPTPDIPGATKTGKANSHLLRAWSGHIDAQESEGMIVDIGYVTKSRIQIHYTVRTYKQAMEDGWANKSQWYSPADDHWAVCAETKWIKSGKSTKKIVGYYRIRTDACHKAESTILTEGDAGHETKMIFESKVVEGAKHITYRFMELADKALETEDLLTIEEARTEIDQFLKLVPIIEQKRREIESIRNRLLKVDDD